MKNVMIVGGYVRHDVMDVVYEVFPFSNIHFHRTDSEGFEMYVICDHPLSEREVHEATMLPEMGASAPNEGDVNPFGGMLESPVTLAGEYTGETYKYHGWCDGYERTGNGLYEA